MTMHRHEQPWGEHPLSPSGRGLGRGAETPKRLNWDGTPSLSLPRQRERGQIFTSPRLPQNLLNFMNFKAFDLVARADVLVVFKGHTAFIAAFDLFDFVFVAF